MKERFQKGETVVVIFHDHGTRYVGKMFNPEWMKKMVDDSIDHAVSVMHENDFSQIPVRQNERIVGSLSESHAYSRIIEDPSIRQQPVQSIMQTAFPYVDIETPVTLLAAMITPEHPAVLVRDFPADKTYIVTGYDVLSAI